MKDMFRNHTSGLESPVTALAEVTPDDGVDLAQMSRALNVASSGFVQVTSLSGDEGRIFVAAGVVFPIRVRRVWETGTTATGIVVLM